MSDQGVPKAYCKDRRSGEVSDVPFGRAAFMVREGMDDNNNFLKLLKARIIRLSTEMEIRMKESLSAKR